MGIKDIIRNDINNINCNINSIYNSLEYIENYGHVGLYDESIGEDEIKYKMLGVNSALEKAEELINEIVDIICEQYQY